MTDTQDELSEMIAQARAEKIELTSVMCKILSVSLLASDLFVAVEQIEEDPNHTDTISLQELTINGTPHVLLFSSKQKLENFAGSSTRFAQVNGFDIISQLCDDFAILNPGSDKWILTPDKISEILENGKDNPPHGHKDHIHGLGCWG